jgi:plasmid maintenance system antidote protein VapI
MNLQQHYDLEICREYEEERIKKEVKPLLSKKNNSHYKCPIHK